MYGLIKCLYDDKTQKSLKSLYSDSDSKTQLLIRSTIAEALKDCPRIIESHGTDFILCTLASYHKSDEDTTRVFQSIVKKLNHMSFGLLTEEIKWREVDDIADTLIVGLSFFRKHMEEMFNRHAAPSLSYYQKAGSLAFQRIGYENISEDFDGWINFIEKELSITSIN
jgi:hypothetical protein